MIGHYHSSRSYRAINNKSKLCNGKKKKGPEISYWKLYSCTDEAMLKAHPRTHGHFLTGARYPESQASLKHGSPSVGLAKTSFGHTISAESAGSMTQFLD